MNRFGNADLVEIETGIINNVPQNTRKSRKYVWKQFMDFCEYQNFHFDANTSNEDLATILKSWAFNMRKIDGTEYKESVLKTIWNLTAKLIQEKYFIEYQRSIDPFKDVCFQSARSARNTKRKALQAIPVKRKVSSVALTPEELKNMVQIWNENTPIGLQRKFYHVAAVELAWRGGEACNCLIHHFQEELNNVGMPTGRIEYNQIFSKTAQGGDHRTSESRWLTPNTKNLDLCPVRLYRKIISKRTPSIKTDRFFLTPNPAWNKTENSAWYKNVPVGRNEISKWTKTCAEYVGLDVVGKKITNHSNRSTAVSLLSQNRVTENEIIKITGHSSTNSIKPYLQLNKEHHTEIISKLRNEESCQQSTTSVSMAIPTPTYYNNCTFNYHYSK